MISSDDPRINIYMKHVVTKLVNSSMNQQNLSLTRLKKKLDESIASKPKLKDKKYPTPYEIAFKINLPGIIKQEKCIRCGAIRIAHTCDLLLCLVCNGHGHEKASCPWRRSSSCSNYDGTLCLVCKSRGHTASDCLDRGYLSKSSFSNLTCYICRRRGHVNCSPNSLT